MKNFDFKKHLMPHLLAFGVFYLVTLVYFAPEFFGNKSITQSDVVLFEGASKQSVDYRKQTGEETLWNPAMFGGTPDYFIATGVKDTPLQYVKLLSQGFIPQAKSAHIFFLYCFCFYITLLCFQVSPYIALAGALAFAFSTYNIINIQVGHVTKTWAIAYSSLVLGGLRLLFRGKKTLGFGLMALALAMQMRSNHFQITYYLAFVCAVMVLAEIISAAMAGKGKQILAPLALAGLAAALGLGTIAGRLMLTKEYMKYSIRGERLLSSEDKNDPKKGDQGLDKDYAFSWSQGIVESFTLLIPNFYGGSSHEELGKGTAYHKMFSDLAAQGQIKDSQIEQYTASAPTYWGDQPFTGGPLYAGAAVCFLFALSFFVLDRKDVAWLAGAAYLALLFAWGHNAKWLNYTMFDYFPGFNKFRSVSMALSMTLSLMALAGFMALDKILKHGQHDTAKLMQKNLYAFGVVGGLLVLVLVGSGFMSYESVNDSRMGMQDFMLDALRLDRKSMLRADIFRSLMFVTAVAALLWAYLKGKMAALPAFALIAVFTLADLGGIGKRYLSDKHFDQDNLRKNDAPSPADLAIMADKDPSYRVLPLNNPFNESRTAYFHKSVGGYFAAKLRRFQDVVERRITGEHGMIIQSLQAGAMPDFSKTPTLNMLNTRYMKFGDSEKQVIKNDEAYGNAWFVKNVVPVKGADEEMAALNTLNPRQSAAIDESFKLSKKEFAADSLASIKMTKYMPREVVYESDNAGDGLAVFSEIYYQEGWTAEIDGKESPILRANYLIRALEIPKGKHQIVFKFNPKSYETGAMITGICAWLVFAFALGGFAMAVKEQETAS